MGWVSTWFSMLMFGKDGFLSRKHRKTRVKRLIAPAAYSRHYAVARYVRRGRTHLF